MLVLQELAPKTIVRAVYGMSEIGGFAMYDDFPAPGSTGRPIGLFDYRVSMSLGVVVCPT